jgi:hypothetical protein
VIIIVIALQHVMIYIWSCVSSHVIMMYINMDVLAGAKVIIE